jgi:hypothetical protein
MNNWVKYRLRDESGTDLGVLMSPNSAWTIGDVVHRGPTAAYAIVSIVQADETDDVEHYLVVTQAPE